MRARCMESVIVVCLLGVALSAVPASAQVPEGIFAACSLWIDDGKFAADSCRVFAFRLSDSTTFIDDTGDEWPYLPLHVARFSDGPPPGTYVPHTNWYKLRARKVIGTVIWESQWSLSHWYGNGDHVDVELVLENTGKTER